MTLPGSLTKHQNLHHYFSSIFYLFMTFLFVIGLLLEYFKLPLGGMPSFPVLVGRVFIAALLLHSFPEVSQLLLDLSQALSHKLGDPNGFFIVRAKMADKFHQFSMHWVSVKETLTVAIAWCCFVLFHFSIYVAEAFQLYTWVMLYIFSPILIALFVLPVTSGATSALYRSLIEVSCWKPVWSVTATLLWSTALSDINKPATDISFFTVICYSLILAGSLVLTPFVVHALAGQGLSQLSKNLGTISLGATVIGPGQVAKFSRAFLRRTRLNRLPGAFAKFSYHSALAGAERVTKHQPALNRMIRSAPRFNDSKKDEAKPKNRPKNPSEKINDKEKE